MRRTWTYYVAWLYKLQENLTRTFVYNYFPLAYGLRILTFYWLISHVQLLEVPIRVWRICRHIAVLLLIGIQSIISIVIIRFKSLIACKYLDRKRHRNEDKGRNSRKHRTPLQRSGAFSVLAYLFICPVSAPLYFRMRQNQLPPNNRHSLHK